MFDREFKMPNFYCNAPGCNASTKKQKNPEKYPHLVDVTFHAFPDARKQPQLRRKWLQLIRREASWQPNKFSRICSLHFVGGKGPTVDNPLPTLFAYNNYKRTEDSKIRETKTSSVASTSLEPARKRKRRSQCMTDSGYKTSRFTVETLNDIKLGGEVVLSQELSGQEDNISKVDLLYHTPLPSDFHNYSQPTDYAVIPSFKDVCTQTDLVMDDMTKMDNSRNMDKDKEGIKNDKKLKRDLNLNSILKDDASVKAYTGFPSKSWLLQIFRVIDSSTDTILYWKGKKQTSKRDEVSPGTNRGRKRVLSKFEEFLFTLVRLRTGLLLWILGDIFSVSSSYGSEIFTSWIHILYNVLSPLIAFPSRAQVDAHMPTSFRKKYPKTRVIIDCTEFFFQRPRATKAQAVMWSSYKSRNTGKVLIGITPAGLISFVSRVYGGNASDRYISQHSGLLDLIEEGDDVMADRGFTIRDLVTLRKGTLNIPPFTRKLKSGKRVLTVKEIKQTRDIASVRIHVERAIQRLKTFKLLSGSIPLVLKDKLYPMIIIAAFLCNLQPKLVTK